METTSLFDKNDIVQTKNGNIGLIIRSIPYNFSYTYKVGIKNINGWYHKYLLEKDLALHIPHEGRSREEMRNLLSVISKLS